MVSGVVQFWCDRSIAPFFKRVYSVEKGIIDVQLQQNHNTQAVLPVLETAVGKSRGMYAAGAYVHQYAQFGVERDDFEEAFLGVGQAVESYRSLG